MSNENKTVDADLGGDWDGCCHVGTMIFNTQRQVAQNLLVATPEMKSDWKILENWLGSTGRELTPIDYKKFGTGWRAYYAIGVAPSHALQASFSDTAKKYKSAGQSYEQDRPPEEVLAVFERMLASDEEIKEKRTTDRAEAELHQQALDLRMRDELLRHLVVTHRKSWWRLQSQSFRAWAFISLTWAAASIFGITVFEPLFLGQPGYDENYYLNVFLVAAAPVIFGLVKKAYDRTVK